ncbi:MAG: hypothetical protein OXC81_05320 [Betaproteobacteria bacterium]|nr:hypothetical protein [Betaproteobacteria bacterium]
MNKESQSAKNDPPPAKSGGGFKRFVLLVALAAGGWWAYSSGRLNDYLPSFLHRLPETAPVPADFATAFSQPEIPETGTIDSAAELSSALPPLAASEPTADEDTADVFRQMEALDTRLSGTEQNLRQMSELLESVATEVAGSPGGSGGFAPLLDVVRIKIELIDMRLRLSGDAAAADSELEQLAKNVAPGTSVAELISDNRRRLAGIPSRSSIFDRLEQIQRDAQAAIDNALRAAQAADSDAATASDGLLGRLFKISDATPARPASVMPAESIAAAAAECIRALAQGQRDAYLEELNKLEIEAAALNDNSPSAYSLSLAKSIAELINIGYPSYSLQLSAS